MEAKIILNMIRAYFPHRRVLFKIDHDQKLNYQNKTRGIKSYRL